MTLLPHRRIFRRAARTDLKNRLWPTLLVALGVLGGGMAALAGFSGDLLGHAGPPPARVVARGPALAMVDVDTLRLQDTEVRLAGVQPPQSGEACRDAQGATEDCGDAAATALSALIGDRPVECRLSGRDSTGHPLGRCAAGGVDLNRAVVAIGWAHAAPGATDLAAAERTARAHHLGLWQRPD